MLMKRHEFGAMKSLELEETQRSLRQCVHATSGRLLLRDLNNQEKRRGLAVASPTAQQRESYDNSPAPMLGGVRRTGRGFANMSGASSGSASPSSRRVHLGSPKGLEAVQRGRAMTKFASQGDEDEEDEDETPPMLGRGGGQGWVSQPPTAEPAPMLGRGGRGMGRSQPPSSREFTPAPMLRSGGLSNSGSSGGVRRVSFSGDLPGEGGPSYVVDSTPVASGRGAKSIDSGEQMIDVAPSSTLRCPTDPTPPTPHHHYRSPPEGPESFRAPMLKSKKPPVFEDDDTMPAPLLSGGAFGKGREGGRAQRSSWGGSVGASSGTGPNSGGGGFGEQVRRRLGSFGMGSFGK